MKDILTLSRANNFCSHCQGTGKVPSRDVGFTLHVGDVVEDHCGLRVRIDKVYDKDPTTGWGTTLNAQNTWVCGPNHENHRVETNNQEYTESLWTMISTEYLPPTSCP